MSWTEPRPFDGVSAGEELPTLDITIGVRQIVSSAIATRNYPSAHNAFKAYLPWDRAGGHDGHERRCLPDSMLHIIELDITDHNVRQPSDTHRGSGLAIVRTEMQ